MLDVTRTKAFEPRGDEPNYVYLPNVSPPAANRYGKPIELVEHAHPLANQSLRINGDESISANPNRYKQHGFYFNADNCISCHACESACSEKNDLPAHLAFRAVGYVEGGSYPDYHRLNISMACNHCDNPVCLKGCPTRAYTKFAEYGAVLQDPDICFGCGYCTWVCPYNAPQLDPVKGRVEKCNMCVDRLEAGLKPACASACLAGALDFGVIETTPENRHQLETAIPGFPTPEITHPNIRFQQTCSLPKEMLRTDNVALRYAREDEQGYKPKLRANGTRREWNLSKLRSREDPLVAFTLSSQAVVGAMLLLFFAPALGLGALSGLPGWLAGLLPFALLGLLTFALVLSTMHLGKPRRFYRAFNNLRYSPVSREVAGLAVFYNFLSAYALFNASPSLLGVLPDAWGVALASLFGWGAAISGPLALYFMHRIYRIPARPFWNHWQVLTAFYGSMFILGPLLVGTAAAPFVSAAARTEMFPVLAGLVLLGIVAQAIGHWRHAKAMRQQGGEGEVSLYTQYTRFGWTSMLRYAAMATGALLCAGLVFGTAGAEFLWVGLVAVMLGAELIGRALFYVLVTPTTMPGAFFWRNQGFQEHARETGLAKTVAAGIVDIGH